MKTALNGAPGLWYSCRVTSVTLSVKLDPQIRLPFLPLVKVPGNKGGQCASETAERGEGAPRRIKRYKGTERPARVLERPRRTSGAGAPDTVFPRAAGRGRGTVPPRLCLLYSSRSGSPRPGPADVSPSPEFLTSIFDRGQHLDPLGLCLPGCNAGVRIPGLADHSRFLLFTCLWESTVSPLYSPGNRGPVRECDFGMAKTSFPTRVSSPGRGIVQNHIP